MGDILEKGDENMANDDWDIDWDIFDKEINRSIETARKTMDLCIEPYIKELAIYKRALELAVREIVYDCGSWKHTIEDEMQDYLGQAKEELEE